MEHRFKSGWRHMNPDIIRLDLFKKELFLFGAIQALALFTVTRIGRPEQIFQPRPVDLGLFLFYFLIATIFFLIFLRFSSRRGFLKIMWMLAVFSGLNIFFGTLIEKNLAFLIAIGLTLLYWRAPTVEFHNFVMVLALPAIGALFGSQIMPTSAVVLLLIFSVYDVIAVYGTKHMVMMASAFLQEHVVPGIILSEKKSAIAVSEVTPGAGFSILGSGDLVFPAVLASSSFLLRPHIGIIVAIFSVLGLFITHTIFFTQKVRRPMPALPAIAIFSIIGFFIGEAIF